MVTDVWHSFPSKFENAEPDDFVVMPDHVHGILWLNPIGFDQGNTSLPVAMQWFKSWTTVLYTQGVKEAGWPRFDTRLWQRNYYERVVRNERELEKLRSYINGNPGRWFERHT